MTPQQSVQNKPLVISTLKYCLIIFYVMISNKIRNTTPSDLCRILAYMPTVRIMAGQVAFSKYINDNVQLKLPKRVKNPAFFMLSVLIYVLGPAKLVCVQPNLKLYPVILLTEVGMYVLLYSTKYMIMLFETTLCRMQIEI